MQPRPLRFFAVLASCLLVLAGLVRPAEAQRFIPDRLSESSISEENALGETLGRLIAIRTVYRYAMRRYPGGRSEQDAAFERALPRRLYGTYATAWVADAMAPLGSTEREVVVASTTSFGAAVERHLHSLGVELGATTDAEPSARQPQKLMDLSALDDRGTVVVSNPVPFLHSAYDALVRNRYVHNDDGALVSCATDAQCAGYSDEYHASCSKGLGAFKYQPPATTAAMSNASSELERIGAAKGYCVYGAQFTPGQNVVLLGRSLADPIATVLLTRLRDANGTPTGLLPGLANTSTPSCKTATGSVAAGPSNDSNCRLVETRIAADSAFNYVHSSGQSTYYFASPAGAAAYPDLSYFTLPANLPAGVYAVAMRYRPSSIIAASPPSQTAVVGARLRTALGVSTLPSYAATAPVLLRVTGDKQDCPYYTYSLKEIIPVVSEEVWDDPEIAYRVMHIHGSELSDFVSSNPTADGIAAAMENPLAVGVQTIVSQKINFEGLDEGEVASAGGAGQVSTRVCRGDVIAIMGDIWEDDGGKTPADAIYGSAVSVALVVGALAAEGLLGTEPMSFEAVGLIASAAIAVLQAVLGAIQHAILPEFLGQTIAVYSQAESRLLTHATVAGLSVAKVRKLLAAGTIELPSLTTTEGKLDYPTDWEKADVVYTNTPRMNGEDTWRIDGGFFHEGVYDEIHELVSNSRVDHAASIMETHYVDRLQARYKLHYRVEAWSGSYGTLTSH